MSTCAKCGGYFSVTKQTAFCPECEKFNMNNVSNCDMPMPQGFGEQRGWICPVCGRGLAPWASFCPCQSDLKITYGTSTGTIDPFAYQEYREILDRVNKALDIGEIKANLFEG